MGQAAAPTAAVALPDPLQQPPSPANVGDAPAGPARNGIAPSSNKTAADPAQSVPPLDLGLTDDLLSKLAGEEIDRLLADAAAAEAVPLAGAHKVTAPAPPAPIAPATSTLTAPSALQPPLAAAAPTSTASDHSAAAGANPVNPLQGSLDDLLNELAGADPSSLAPIVLPAPATSLATASPTSPAVALVTSTTTTTSASPAAVPHAQPSPATSSPAAPRSIPIDDSSSRNITPHASHAALQASVLDQAIAADAAKAISDLQTQPDGASAATDAPAAPALAPAVASATAPALASAPAPSADAQTSTAELAALAQSIPDADAPTTNSTDAGDASLHRVPLYLKPLVWLNAPALLLPADAREALGKVALLTLFNAVAVLIYVALFRRPHH